jgi:ATP-binding cassette, subfamily B, multidrug efflux pump
MIKLLRFFKPYRLTLVFVLILAFVQSITNLYLPNLLANIIDLGVARGDTIYIVRTGGWMLLITLVGVISAIVGIFFSSKVATSFGKIIREQIFAHIEKFSLLEFDTVSTASMITRTTNDTAQVQQVMVQVLDMLITIPMTVIGGTIMAVNQDPTLSWILVGIVPILAGAILLLLNRSIPHFRSMQVQLDKLNLILHEGLTGVRIVRAFDRVKHEEERFDRANLDLTHLTIRVNKMMSFLMPLMLLLLSVSSVIIIWFGSIRINDGQLQVGAMIAFLQYTMQILLALMMVSIMFFTFPRAATAADRINEILGMKSGSNNIDEENNANEGWSSLEFRDVTFRYPGAEEPALSHVSFRTVPGEITAIIGSTGAGKSTLISLIPRLYEIDSGSILVNGIDIRTISPERLRAKIGLVSQKTVLFSGSLKENLRYGKKDATDEEMQHAAEIAQASEFITEMPDGFDSLIAQGGNNVSGGQKQRVAIARALVRKPEIYIFDDSFSALDFKTDRKLRAALKKETLSATVLMVAQRVSTVIEADQIIVLDEGRIVGIGTHKGLMESCNVYREIISSQLSLEEIA